MKKFSYYLFLITLMLGTGSVLSYSATQTVNDTFIPYNDATQVIVDGTINNGEYTGFYEETNTGITIHWEHDGVNMHVGLISPGTGWVAIGFGPEGQKMPNANVVIGFVDDTTGEVNVFDQFAEGRTHGDDSQNDLVDFDGSQSVDKTFIEFVFPLNSGDSFDHSYEMGGTYGIIVSLHSSTDNIGTKHTDRFEPITAQIEAPPMTTVGSTTETMDTITTPEFSFGSVYLISLLIGMGLIYVTKTYLQNKLK